MHFGEYELSPSLISLSPLPSVHWNTFQRIPIRTSSWCYPTFILTKGRSLGFASTHSDYTALLRLAFASAPDLKSLTLPEKVTRRFIMQKARRHILTMLRPLVGRRVQGLFHSPARGSFHLSLTVLVRYRSLGSI